ncbi:MAG TPA: hypothetical protein RMG45_12975, partial [Polyangiaceae bacterium LLY-WYZ-15_(1-7)]|nr:hypothetical protein [Polyangiaceae bacterium LLY-WYZ-15_(1-7)]
TEAPAMDEAPTQATSETPAAMEEAPAASPRAEAASGDDGGFCAAGGRSPGAGLALALAALLLARRRR